MHFESRERKVNNYIFTVQVLFSLMTLITIFKYFGFESYNSLQAIAISFLIIIFLMSIGYSSFYLDKQFYWLDIIIILFDFLFITLLFIRTGYFELRFLYLIPITLSTIKFKLLISLSISVFIGIMNLVLDMSFLSNMPIGYSIETNLVFLTIYVIVSWLLGNFIRIESSVRENLYETQKNLIEHKSLLENLINEMPLCVVVIDKEEKIVHINQAALNFASINDSRPEGYVGLPYREYVTKLLPDSSYEDLLILQTLHNGTSYYKEKIIIDNRLTEITIQPIYGHQKNIICAMAIFYDITAEEIINEKIKQLESMNLVGQMAATIAHEIKNPLTTIKGFLQLAKKSKGNLSEDNLDLLISEIERCNSIILDFLSISKKSTRSLKSILEKQLVLIEKDALQYNIHLNLELGTISDLIVNQNEIKQLILNLTHNSIDAMPNGGVLSIKLKENLESIILEIEDEGEGIPKNILNKLGTPFVTTKKKGTGLGLSVCYRIAESHGAKIEIDSKRWSGTNVTVIFPKELKD